MNYIATENGLGTSIALMVTMISRLNFPSGVILFVVAALPAIGLAQSPLHQSPPVAVQAITAAAPIPIAPAPPPEVIPGGISAEVWHHALSAHDEVAREGKTTSPLLTVIDYSRPATEKRLWVVDLRSGAVVDTEYVAHGEGSGDRLAASRFSNLDGSHQSSLGTFLTGDVFFGVRGRSLELHGLEAGINDNAYARGLLIHGTPYVSEARALRGTQGLTEGCAGVPARSAKRLIRLIAHGSVVFVWYPDLKFLRESAYLDRTEAQERLAAAD
jgi:hypothetical protein